MKAKTFKEVNVVIAENQPEYLKLPACVLYQEDGCVSVTTRWKLSFIERIVVLFTGDIWMCTLTSGSFPPTKMTTKKSDLL